ncbi:unnamed protein product [Brassica napus]|uniref:(rape) hypothetical protein n=1 Tax=Brassica napus TaxID=3708 RepID=A0A816KDD2_BRANA|nr:unnamed protein product [Brassica napus]
MRPLDTPTRCSVSEEMIRVRELDHHHSSPTGASPAEILVGKGKLEAEPRADDYTGVADVSPEPKANGFPRDRTAVGDISRPKVLKEPPMPEQILDQTRIKPPEPAGESQMSTLSLKDLRKIRERELRHFLFLS